eukprot:364326-Chlamydomonas_euryale.AAC.17
MEQGFDSVPPCLPAQGSFRRRCSNLWPRDQFSAARNLRKSRKVVPPPEPFSRHPQIAELYIP